MHVWIQQVPQITGLIYMTGKGDVSIRPSCLTGYPGEKRNVTGFQFALSPPIPDLCLEYMCHNSVVGDEPYFSEGKFQGSRDKNKQIEGFAVRLAGPRAAQFHVCYYAHIAGRGNNEVCVDGAYCGTRSLGRAIEGIQIYLIRR